MSFGIEFDPLLPLLPLGGLGALSLMAVALAFWQGLAGAALRLLAAAFLVLALANPQLLSEERAPLPDIVLLVKDQSESQSLGARPVQMSRAAEQLAAQIAARENVELREVSVLPGPDEAGTALFGTLARALAELPRNRVSGILVLSDGLAHDPEVELDLPAPLHHLQTGEAADWDRRIVIEQAPSFAILGEAQEITLRIAQDGAVPETARFARLSITIGAELPFTFEAPLDREIIVPVTLTRGGKNIVQISVDAGEGELTARNNAALLEINGVRDRLRVLLVSGEPHAGGRTWRNLLKSDSSVDLVHFTILRPPEKHDGVPVGELSLIAFPTRELFIEKIEDFDLIIFDRYKRRGILPAVYLDNVRQYVEMGGAMLVAAGPDFASAESLYRSPLGRIIPARPTARVIEEKYPPIVTEIGARHPVTQGFALSGEAERWGRWMRQIELEPGSGETVLTGYEDKPLLILEEAGEGRVALLASDNAWLWARGFEGGGPQLELLRRLAHWLMKEPELEAEALLAEATEGGLKIIRRTLEAEAGDVTVALPDGSTATVVLQELQPGLFEGILETDASGIFRLEDGSLNSVVGLGATAQLELAETIARREVLAPAVEALRGGQVRLEEGLPRLRNVRGGRNAAGRGWLGLTPRGAFDTIAMRRFDLFPPWLALVLFATLMVSAWLREGRR